MSREALSFPAYMPFLLFSKEGIRVKLAFTKMHGCGNDYIYFDCTRQPMDRDLASQLAVRLSDREKIDNSIPSKETVAAYILEKGEQYAAEQLRAQDRDSLRRSWGEPDATPSGIWADVWDLDADTTILVFYDAENDDKVERVVIGQKGG